MDSILAAWDALKFGGVMVYPLIVMALLAMVIILDKAWVYLIQASVPHKLVALIEHYDFDWRDLEGQLSSLGSKNQVAHFLSVVTDNRTQPAWWVESRAGDAAQNTERSLSRGLWVLETIVTAAPLLGLLGTITGMMQSFKLIGAQGGLVDPTGVTSGVAQALIATALGLLIALVSLFGFNFFARRQAQTMDELERLGTRLVDHIRLDQERSVIQQRVAGAGHEAP
jgi:biopolymer transport protein ExbB